MPTPGYKSMPFGTPDGDAGVIPTCMGAGMLQFGATASILCYIFHIFHCFFFLFGVECV